MFYRFTAQGNHHLTMARKRSLANRLRALEESQWWSPERLRESSWRKVQDLLAHAYNRVPYYREIFKKAGGHPNDVRTPKDFQKFPILTKAAIQRGLDSLIATGVDRQNLRKNHTGGSTGQMLTFYQDRHYKMANTADKFLTYGMCGYRPGDPWVIMRGIDYGTRRGRWSKSAERLRFNLLRINTFDLDWKGVGDYAQALQSFRPTLVVGYVSSLTLFADYIQQHGGLRIRPKAIQPTAEMLTEMQRRKLETVFGCKALNRYGCREVGNIAQECEAHDGLHVLNQTTYLEIVDKQGTVLPPGQPGHIVVTNLTNYAFPLIRYSIGDVGIAAPDTRCACGRGMPRIDRIEGRAADIIVSPEGKLLHGEFFTHLFYGMPGVRQFQVIQTTPRILLIRIVKGAEFEEHRVIEQLRNVILEHGSPSFEIDFEFPEQIPVSASGKHRFTMSYLSPAEVFPAERIQ
ncbi:MAG: phenylacetate--CoA ligase family protein [Candidatus Binatia bacterium]